jgi:glycerate 2-kinase
VNASLTDAARECLLAAIRAANPRELTASALRSRGTGGVPGGIQVIAVGKAAPAMLRGAIDALGDLVAGGVMISPDISGALPGGVLAFAGGHPMPNAEGARGARAIERLARDAGSESRLLALISGGASALMTLPADDIPLEALIETSRSLMAAGADIRELNGVRKHLDRLKGGLLARAVGGAAVRALVLSDVIGDPLDVIGSGPLVPDPTTYDDAIGVLRRRGVWHTLPRSVTAHLLAGARGERPETPKEGDPCFMNVEIDIIGNNALAVRGAADEARRRGFDVEVIGVPVSGEARDAGGAFARRALDVMQQGSGGRGACIVSGGETTVTVIGSGVGGRNLEFAAAAALVIDGVRGIAIGSIGTDGRDGPTDAAGAVVNGDSAAEARAFGVDLARHLRDNDVLAALDAVRAVIRTGATGTNVMDVQVAMIAAEPAMDTPHP